MHVQLVQGVEAPGRLLFAESPLVGREPGLDGVGDEGDGESHWGRQTGPKGYSCTSFPLTTWVIGGAACGWNSPALSLRMYA